MAQMRGSLNTGTLPGHLLQETHAKTEAILLPDQISLFPWKQRLHEHAASQETWEMNTRILDLRDKVVAQKSLLMPHPRLSQGIAFLLKICKRV